MNVPSTGSTLQALLGQLNGVKPVAPQPAARTQAPQQHAAAAQPQKAAPANKAPLNPNAPRGTYVNIVV